MKKSNEFPSKCKVCGLGEIEEMYGVCPYCGWEEDISQEEDSNCIDGPNKMSLNQYKQFWEENKECILKTLKENPFIWMDLSESYYEKYFKEINEKLIALEENEFFDYKDPLAKDQLVKCSICGQVAFQDQYGNGECKNCGWKFSKDENQFEKDYGISYPMLVSPTTARNQYQQGLPFKATFDEFINGLYFYSEMTFIHNNINYEVYFNGDYEIIFCSSDMQQNFKTREDFKNNAQIRGKLLKDIWNEVSFAGFMFCG